MPKTTEDHRVPEHQSYLEALSVFAKPSSAVVIVATVAMALVAVSWIVGYWQFHISTGQ